MESHEIKKEKQVAWVISIGFFVSVTAFVSALFFPPDFSVNPPLFPKWNMIFIEMSSAFYIFSCTIYGLKLAEEKKTLPAAGFTVMAIAQGVIFVLNFVDFNSESIEEAYRTFCGTMYLLIPAILLIGLFSEFPKWLNIITIISVFPLVIVYIIYIKSDTYQVQLDYLSFSNVVFQNFISVVWAIIILKRMKKKVSQD